MGGQRHLLCDVVHARDHVDPLALIEQLDLADRDGALVPVQIGVALLREARRLAPAHRIRHLAHDTRRIPRVLQRDHELVGVERLGPRHLHHVSKVLEL